MEQKTLVVINKLKIKLIKKGSEEAGHFPYLEQPELFLKTLKSDMQ